MNDRRPEGAERRLRPQAPVNDPAVRDQALEMLRDPSSGVNFSLMLENDGTLVKMLPPEVLMIKGKPTEIKTKIGLGPEHFDLINRHIQKIEDGLKVNGDGKICRGEQILSIEEARTVLERLRQLPGLKVFFPD